VTDLSEQANIPPDFDFSDITDLSAQANIPADFDFSSMMDLSEQANIPADLGISLGITQFTNTTRGLGLPQISIAQKANMITGLDFPEV
jgi:hypothetical protein